MALTTHKNKPKKPLEAAERVKVKDQVDRADVVKDEVPKAENKSVTFPVNIRVDNHIRNQVTAFINVGIEGNMKALVSHMIEREIESLDPSQLSRFEKMVEILEEKDYYSKGAKQAVKK